MSESDENRGLDDSLPDSSLGGAPDARVVSMRVSAPAFSPLTGQDEICIRCGMVANVDPWFHAQRYDHQPAVIRDGVAYEHDGGGAFTVRVVR